MLIKCDRKTRDNKVLFLKTEKCTKLWELRGVRGGVDFREVGVEGFFAFGGHAYVYMPCVLFC